MTHDNRSGHDRREGWGPLAKKGLADVAIAGLNTIKAILDDWKAVSIIAVVLLLIVGKVAGAELMDGLVRVVEAWRGTGA